jgi:hypothetical protein
MLKLNQCFGLVFNELNAGPKIMLVSPLKVLVRIIPCPVNRIWLECSF